MTSFLRRFAVRGVFWRQYLDWAVINTPFYIQPVLIFFWTIFFFFFAAPARRAVLVNLRHVLPGSSPFLNYLRAWRTLYNFAWTITEAANFKINGAQFAYEIEGEEFLEQLARGAGAIVLTAHIGNYDLGAGLFSRKFGRELQMVREPEPHAETDQHLRESLQQTGAGGVKVAYSTEGTFAAFDLLGALRRGEIVSIQGDRLPGHVSQTSARLFGADIELPQGPFILALVSGASIYPLFIVRLGYRRYRVIARRPIACVRTGRPRAEDIAAAVAEWCAVLEKIVRRYWQQWYAFRPPFSRNVTG